MQKHQQEWLEGYKGLLTDFIERKISPSNFQALYFRKFKDEERIIPEKIFRILDWLFAETDSYCEDPTLRDSGDIGDDELLISAKRALSELNELA